jgi:hypothetical protein
MVQLTFNQDFASTTVDYRFGIGGALGFAPGQVSPYFMDIKPTSAARSATNPSTVFAWLNNNYTVISNGVGELATVSLQFPMTGRAARLTA